MLELHDLHRKSNHPAVDGSVPAVAIRIDGDVGCITVLVLAVLRRAPDAAIVIRRPKTGVYIESQLNIVGGSAMPSRELGDDELYLV